MAMNVDEALMLGRMHAMPQCIFLAVRSIVLIPPTMMYHCITLTAGKQLSLTFDQHVTHVVWLSLHHYHCCVPIRTSFGKYDRYTIAR